MAGRVIKGEYKGKAVGLSVGGKTAYIFTKRFSVNKDSWLELSSKNVKNIEVINENAQSAGDALLKEAMYGTAAAVNGGKVLLSAEFKDGKKSLIECDKKIYKAIQINCFDA